MRYFFWNVRGKKVNYLLEKLIVSKKYDIVILCEYYDDINELIDELAEKNINMLNVTTPGCERITILSNRKCKTGFSDSHFTIKLFKMSQNDIKIVVSLHLQSQMYNSDSTRRAELETIRVKVEELEEKYNTNKSIIVGDFNANPFDNCMIDATGMHAISSREVVNKIERTISGKSYKMFYNPMWNKFGDFDKPSGTYFYRKADMNILFWNIFDQVVIRPQLIDKFRNEELNIVTKIDDIELLKNDRIQISDHLPIEFLIEED